MTPIQKAKEMQLEISKILVANKYKIKVEKNDIGIYAVDVPVASKAIVDFLATPQAAALLSGEDWISVKTELPPIGKDVLVVENDGFDNGVDIATYTGKNREFYRPFKPIQVTHWMNIPALPEPIKP